MSDAAAVARWLEETYPELSPNERFQQFQQLTGQAIEAGLLAAILRPDGDIVVKHVEWCSDGELAARMTAEQYRLWSER